MKIAMVVAFHIFVVFKLWNKQKNVRVGIAWLKVFVKLFAKNLLISGGIKNDNLFVL